MVGAIASVLMKFYNSFMIASIGRNGFSQTSISLRQFKQINGNWDTKFLSIFAKL
jgi:hypothetical protein